MKEKDDTNMKEKDDAIEYYHQLQLDSYFKNGGVVLGPYTSHIWRSDPRHLCFLLARYKFVAKMVEGKRKILEVGCGDSFGTALILQTAENVHAIDIESPVIKENKKRNDYGDRVSYEVRDITAAPLESLYDGAFSLDVIEHIPNELEDRFMSNISNSLDPGSCCITGTPNITAHKYASEGSQIGHINLKSHSTLKELMERHFSSVLMFSMNDEVVHTGFHPMAHYIIGVGIKG